MRERESIQALWRDVSTAGAAALATVCRVRGSAYRRPGARMLLASDGRSAGVISGGCLDADLWRRANEVISSGQPQRVCYDSSSADDIVWGLGLGCRGQVDLLVEPVVDLDWMADGITVAAFYEGDCLGTRIIDHPTVQPRVVAYPEGRALVQTFLPAQPLWIFGTGADVVPLHRMATDIGWRVRVVDLQPPHPQRPARVPSRHVPVADLPALRIEPDAAIVIMTHRFVDDLEILQAVQHTELRYCGILGPRSRTDELLQAVSRRTEISDRLMARLHAPVGLDTGAETPEEIALSILAEIQSVISGRSGGFLRERSGPIHDIALPLVNEDV